MENVEDTRRPSCPKGLLGGSMDVRLQKRGREQMTHRWFLDPVGDPEHAAALRDFVSHSPLFVEIGFGRGSFLSSVGRATPDANLLGVEIRRKYCRIALGRLDRNGTSNVRVLLGDVRELLPRFLDPGSIDRLFVLFPDPWWKKKHFRRRVLDPEFVSDLSLLLKPGALAVVRSDVPMVMELASSAFLASSSFRSAALDGEQWPPTDRQLSCGREGTPTFEAAYQYLGKPHGGEE